jgi:hypothetical protein
MMFLDPDHHSSPLPSGSQDAVQGPKRLRTSTTQAATAETSAATIQEGQPEQQEPQSGPSGLQISRQKAVRQPSKNYLADRYQLVEYGGEKSSYAATVSLLYILGLENFRI